MNNYLKKLWVWFLIVVFTQTMIISSAAAFSIGDEREAGEKLLYSVRSAFKVFDDPDITQYVTKLGISVLNVAGIQYFDYHFFVIEDSEFNAFAAPSGLLFFQSGLINAVQTEDEFISVIAHEIGHIVKRHLASSIERGTFTTIGTLGLALAAIAFGGSAAPALFTGALATGQSINLHFSRENEEEADLLAYGWLRKLNRNPQGMADMMETMRRIARYRSDKLPQYLLTHPNPEARLNYIDSLIDIDKAKIIKATKPSDNFEFLRFKYRVLSQIEDTQSFKSYLASVVSNPRADKDSQTMAKYGLSQLARVESDYNRALNLLRQVQDVYPDRDILNVDRAVIEMEAGQFPSAERIFQSTLQKNSHDVFAKFNLAKLYELTRRDKDAEKYFKEVSIELPEYSKVFFELGQIADRKNENGIAKFYLGKFYLYEGKLPLAEQNFRIAARDKSLPTDMAEEAKALKKRLKELQK
jgi:predicted Zn-dependent protease